MEATQQPSIKSFPCRKRWRNDNHVIFLSNFSSNTNFLEKKLEDKGKQIEQRSKLDKEVVQLKFKGNQKQFELNAELDTIFESIKTDK